MTQMLLFVQFHGILLVDLIRPFWAITLEEEEMQDITGDQVAKWIWVLTASGAIYKVGINDRSIWGHVFAQKTAQVQLPWVPRVSRVPIGTELNGGNFAYIGPCLQLFMADPRRDPRITPPTTHAFGSRSTEVLCCDTNAERIEIFATNLSMKKSSQSVLGTDEIKMRSAQALLLAERISSGTVGIPFIIVQDSMWTKFGGKPNQLRLVA